jgi:phosphate:Na+ symporter
MLYQNYNKQISLIAKMFLLFALLFISFSVFAAGGVIEEMHWGMMAVQLLGGLALFLFGMDLMSDALKAVAGDKMKTILKKLTSNRFMGAATGAGVTAVIQSSSVTTVLVVGFISANLMTMSQSVGVIMGANIGTTITAQIVAFKVTKAALLMIAIGYGMQFSPKNEKIKQYGLMIMGLGMIFFGMSVMSNAMQPLRTYQPFLDLMISMDNPLIGIAVAAVFTGLIQSSSATTGIVIVMASQGFISLPAGIALAFGANIGTCVTALLASIGKPREAVRAAAVHVFFNVAGVLIWVMFIDQLADFVRHISPARPELTGLDKLGAETPRQIANAHTIFNVANTFIFIWFTNQIASLVVKLIPDKPSPLEEEGLVVEAKYLDEYLLSTPSLALDRVRLEVLHMGEIVNDMLNKIMPAILDGSKKTITKIESRDDEVDLLYEQIVDYLGQISKGKLTESQMEELLALMEAVGDLENIGDTIETNLVDLGMDRLTSDFTISGSTRKVLTHFHQQVSRAVDGAIQAVSQNNVAVAQRVIDMKDNIAHLASFAAEHQAERLVADEPNRIKAYTTEIDIIEKQKRIYYFAKRMAKTVVENGDD